MKWESHAHFTVTYGTPLCCLLIIIFFSDANHPAATRDELSSSSSPVLATDLRCDPVPATQAFQSRGQMEERDLGMRLAAEREKASVVLADDLILQYLNQLEHNIITRSDIPGCFVVKLLVDSEPNAFSLPGGFVYVTTGLIESTDSEGELVAALAHETAHIVAHHVTKYLDQTRIWGRIASWGGPGGYLLHRYVSPLVMFRLIRQEEFEADRLGLQYELAAGYDSLDFSSLLQKAVPDTDDGGSLLDRLLDTHPTTAARLKRLTSSSPKAALLQPRHVMRTDDFQRTKAQLERLMCVQHS